jgi:peroxiredoxin
MPNEGDIAPDFTTIDHAGNEVSLVNLRGQRVWLWFFSSPGGGN